MKRSTLKSWGRRDGMLSCFPSKFARLAKIGSVAKAKQSLVKRNQAKFTTPMSALYACSWIYSTQNPSAFLMHYASVKSEQIAQLCKRHWPTDSTAVSHIINYVKWSRTFSCNSKMGQWITLFMSSIY